MNKGKSTGMWVSAIAFMVILAGAINAFGDDFVPPQWRGSDGTTFQEWSFSTPDKENLSPDGNPLTPPNPPYYPYLYVNSTYQYNDAAGAWPLGELDLFIPNFSTTGLSTTKLIQIQLTWQGATNNFMPPQPSVNAVPDFSGDPSAYLITDISRLDFQPIVDDGWNRSLFLIKIQPNPSEEWITIKGDIIVDHVVVDTYCVPEPATFGLLICGALLAFRRRRKS